MSVTITSGGPCACCRAFQSKLGKESLIGFVSPGYTFPTQHFGVGSSCSFDVAFGPVTASGTAASGTLALSYNWPACAGTMQANWFGQLSNDPCGFNLAFPSFLEGPGSGSFSPGISVPSGSFPNGVVVSQGILTGTGVIPDGFPLLSYWVFGDADAFGDPVIPQFIIQLQSILLAVGGNTLVENQNVNATISNVADSVGENLTWAVADNDGDGTYCGGPLLGGTGVFNFLASRTIVPLPGSAPGQTWDVSIACYSRPHGSSGPFLPAGVITNEFITTESDQSVPFHIGWPLGFGFDVMIDAGPFTIVRTA